MFHLRAEQIGKRFGRRILFKRLSLEVKPREAIAITGSNGSGKSTLVQVLAGIQRPTKGTVTLLRDGTPLANEKRMQHVGLVAPYLNVYEGFSAYENLAFIAKARQIEHAEVKMDAILERVGLGGRGDDLVSTYSSGMKQRVRFAVALLPEPPLLFLDEPTSNLDEKGIAMVHRVIDAHRAGNGLLIVATNDAEEAARCDRSICVEDFR